MGNCSDGVTGAMIANSKEALRPRYVERFKSPVHCELLGRLVLGNVVVDREIITGVQRGQRKGQSVHVHPADTPGPCCSCVYAHASTAWQG